MMISFKTACVCIVVFSAFDLAAGHCQPTPRQRLLHTHRQGWLSLLWGHCSFLLGPGEHQALFVPSKSLFPQSSGSSVIKSHWPPKSNPLGILSPFAECPSWEICCGSQNFLNMQEFLWYNCSAAVGHLLSGSMVGLMATSKLLWWSLIETSFILLGSKITSDGDYSHEFKRCLLLGRITMINLDNILKCRDITLQQQSFQSRLWFFQWSCMDVRVGP